jgi:hypothetical protein
MLLVLLGLGLLVMPMSVAALDVMVLVRGPRPDEARAGACEAQQHCQDQSAKSETSNQVPLHDSRD